MRFYLGFGKRIPLKWFLLIAGGLLAFFGIGNLTVLASSYETLQSWSYCPFNSTSFNSTGCWDDGATYTGSTTVNGISNVTKLQNSRFSYLGYTGLDKHTEFYKYAGYGSDCSTGNQVRFYVDVVMTDVENTFPNNVLDPNSFPSTPIVRSSNIKSGNWQFNQYYNWLANNSSDPSNKVGVSVGKSDGSSFSQCSFVSYGSNKSIRYLCSSPTGSGGRQIKLNLYNSNEQYKSTLSSHSAMIVSGVKVTILSDPCAVEPNNNQGVINSINGQTGSIVEGISGIIDNNNSNQAQTHQDLQDINNNISDFKNQQHNDLTNTNPNTSSASNTLGDWLTGDGTVNDDLNSILTAPIRLYDGIKNSDPNTCQGLSLPISFRGFNKNVVVPCGDIFWDQFDLTTLAIYYTLVYGALAYALLIFLVKELDGLIDPNDLNEITVMNL